MEPPRGFEILDRQIAITSSPGPLRRALRQLWGRQRPLTGEPDLSYRLLADGPDGPYRLARSGGTETVTGELGSLLQAFDADLSVELQKLRRDLFFLHSGAVCWADEAMLLVGASGSGKSMCCWGLANLGATFMSDELAPVDLERLAVLPYLRSIGLKDEPPEVFPLAGDVLRTTAGIHLPATGLPGGVRRAPVPIAALVFLRQEPASTDQPVLEKVSAGQAAARLYAGALNALAHPDDGLTAAAALASAVPSYVLERGELRATCELLLVGFGPEAERGRGSPTR